MSRRMLDLGSYGRVPIDNLFEMFHELKTGDVLKIYQTRNIPSLGAWVYDAAVCLAVYLESDHFSKQLNSENFLQGKSLIELGAGTGIVGLVAGHYGADVVLSDLESLVPLMQLNINENIQLMKGPIYSMPLIWGSEEMIKSVLQCTHNKDQDREKEEKSFFDLIVLANCVYYESSLDLLLATVLSLAGSGSLVLACYEERSTEIEALIGRWHSIVSKHFEIENVRLDSLDSSKETEKHLQSYVKVVIMRLKR